MTPELQAHRRGRFLASLLGIANSSEHGLPQTGLVLMTGEALQASRDSQEAYAAWVRQPGCSLLLLPPYHQGSIFYFLDWSIELAPSTSLAAKHASLASMLAGELTYNLRGLDGACTENMSREEPTSHTRYWKAHSNSGLIAATTLPLWSISLLDQAALVHDFLANIKRHCGTPAINANEAMRQEDDTFHSEDVTVLVCCFGFNVVTAEGLMCRLRTYAVPLLNLESFDVQASLIRLKNATLINAHGLTEKGLDYLMGSKYWAYAESLRDEASR